VKAFLLSGPALVSQPSTRAARSAALLKDQQMMKRLYVSVAWAALGLAVLPAGAASFTEDFSTDPAQRGWQTFGDTNLFAWNATNQNLEVTWDSTQANSYFFRPLGTILTTNDDFSLEFDLRLTDVTTTNYGCELAIGLLHYADATSPGFQRTTGVSPNVAEFDCFPPSQIPPSVDATLIDSSNNFAFAYEAVPLEPGVVYHVRLSHVAGETSLSGEVLTNGEPVTTLPDSFGAIAADFRLDMLAISSYQDDGYGDDILAHGTVDNLVLTLPPLPVQNLTGAFTNGLWQCQFDSRTNWSYRLERTEDFQSWTPIGGAAPGTGARVALSDSSYPPGQAFYRVAAFLP